VGLSILACEDRIVGRWGGGGLVDR
jgi:hypothetical protein